MMYKLLAKVRKNHVSDLSNYLFGTMKPISDRYQKTPV